MLGRDTVYRDKANATIEHFTYCDGQKVTVSRAWADREFRRGTVRFIDLWRTAEENHRINR